jgi:aconitase B
MSGDVMFQSFMGNLPALITAIGAVVFTIRNGRKTDEVGKKQDVANDKQDSTIDAIAQVHEATNGNLSKVTAELAASRKETAGLKDVVSQAIGKSLAGQPVSESPK